MQYLFFKWLHLIAVISWMCGVLYGYRLLVNLADRGEDAKIRGVLVEMFGRLYRVITMPAMGIAILAGFGMIATTPQIMKGAGWLHTKLLMVVLLIVSTVLMKRYLRRLEAWGADRPQGKTLRLLNEVPTLLMMVIVGLAVFKPF